MQRTPYFEPVQWGSQRTTVSLAGMEINRSHLRIRGQGIVRSPGRQTVAEFDQLQGTIDVEPGSQGRIKIYLVVEYRIDNEGEDNDFENSYWVSYPWRYHCTPDGAVSFEPTRGPAGIEYPGLPQGAPNPGGSVVFVDGPSVGIQLTLVGPYVSGSSTSVSAGAGVNVNVPGEPGGSVGPSVGWSRTGAVPSTANVGFSRPFVLTARVRPPDPGVPPSPPANPAAAPGRVGIDAGLRSPSRRASAPTIPTTSDRRAAVSALLDSAVTSPDLRGRVLAALRQSRATPVMPVPIVVDGRTYYWDRPEDIPQMIRYLETADRFGSR